MGRRKDLNGPLHTATLLAILLNPEDAGTEVLYKATVAASPAELVVTAGETKLQTRIFHGQGRTTVTKTKYTTESEETDPLKADDVDGGALASVNPKITEAGDGRIPASTEDLDGGASVKSPELNPIAEKPNSSSSSTDKPLKRRSKRLAAAKNK